MAKIRHMTQTGYNKIDKFLGVNESPTGANSLKNGEAEYMRNYRVSLDGKLELRPGAELAYDGFTGAISAMWSGYLNGEEILLAASDGMLYKLTVGEDGMEAQNLGAVGAVDPVSMFAFQDKIYLLNGWQYYCWDGTGAPYEVEGYVPLVVTAAAPSGGGTELEGLNILSDKYRVQFSPDGTSTEFYLPVEGTPGIYSISVDGNVLETSKYYLDLRKNCVGFLEAPQRGINTVEVTCYIPLKSNAEGEELDAEIVSSDAISGYGFKASFQPENSPVIGIGLPYGGANGCCTGCVYTYDPDTNTLDVYFNLTKINGSEICDIIAYTDDALDNQREIAEKMKYAVLYNGATDSRVFLYGDGSNTCIYSGIDENGVPRADYFPALNQANIGAANSPITSMVRHYNALIAYKPDETYRITYDTQTLTGGNTIAGFYIRPVHSEIGCIGYNQATLVYNNPRTICHNSIYDWRLSYYTSAANRDERNAQRVSDRVKNTLSGMDLKHAVCFDDADNYEYWVTDGTTSIINNYANDTWYIYDGLPITCFTRYKGELYIGTTDGAYGVICRMNRGAVTDQLKSTDTHGIQAEWHGAIFDGSRDYLNKWTIDQYVGLLNQADNRVVVTLETDRVTGLPEHTVLADANAKTPTIHHIKERAKGWAFLRTILKSVPGYPSTIVSLDTSYRNGTGGRRV